MSNEFHKTAVLSPGVEHLAVLRKYFGHSQFRPLQWEIIRKIIEDRCDLCVVMATGYGKSLCYQYPAVYTGGVVIVISPLISLMHDQVLSLEMASISACLLGSAQKNNSAVIEGILKNDYRVVYITPEFCSSDYGSSILEKFSRTLNIVLVAIDEAHCVSQWGFDFRTSYRKLGILKNIFPNVPLLTVTATATLQVCKDICSSLNLRSPQVIRTDFDRPNLYLGVSLKTGDVFSDIRRFLKRNGLKWTFPGSTIIYCPTKKMAETVSSVLNDNAVSCSVYHAELPMKRRTDVHDKFVKDEIQVIAATVAFGMGIDKPDIRLVIHYGSPKDIESYYQEIGRAGRDGLPSTCHVFYKPADFVINHYFLKNLSGEYREHRLALSKLVEKYLDTHECRRDLIISYFDPGKKAAKPEGVKYQSNCCDNCTNRLRRGNSPDSKPVLNEVDFRNDVLLLLRAVSVFDGRRGLSVPILLLRGSRTNRLPSEYFNHKLFGAGKNKSEGWWKALGRLLTSEELLAQQCSFMTRGKGFNLPTVKVTTYGWNFISNPEKFPIKLTPTNELIALAKTEPNMYRSSSRPVLLLSKELVDKKVAVPQTDVKSNVSSKPIKTPLSKEESELMYEMYYGLMKLRTDMASRFGCMPYMIANNKMLMDLAKIQPKSKEELAKIEGFSQNKVDKFSDEIIKEIIKLLENFKTKSNGVRIGDYSNELENESSIDSQSKLFADEDNIWGEEDDSFLMTTPFQVLSDFQYSNDNTNNINDKPDTSVINSSDNLWPDLDLSVVEVKFDEIISDNCENSIKPSTSTSSDCKTHSYFNNTPMKRKTAMLEYEDSDSGDDNNFKDDFVDTSSQFKKKQGKCLSSPSSSSSLQTSSRISRKPLPNWINKPDAKKVLHKNMKKNSLFKR